MNETYITPRPDPNLEYAISFLTKDNSSNKETITGPYITAQPVEYPWHRNQETGEICPCKLIPVTIIVILAVTIGISLGAKVLRDISRS